MQTQALKKQLMITIGNAIGVIVLMIILSLLDEQYLSAPIKSMLRLTLSGLFGLNLGILLGCFAPTPVLNQAEQPSAPTANRTRSTRVPEPAVHEIQLTDKEDPDAAALRYARPLGYTVYSDATGIFINVDGELQPIRFIEAEESGSFEYE